MPALAALATAVLMTGLAAAAVIDHRTGRLPDPLTFSLAAAGLIFTWLLQRDLTAALFGIIAGYGALWALNTAFRALRGRDGLGMGDAKLLAAAGAWLGWAPLPFVLLIASALGLAGVALARLRGKAVEGRDELRFGPYLAVAIAIAWWASFGSGLQR